MADNAPLNAAQKKQRFFILICLVGIVGLGTWLWLTDKSRENYRRMSIGGDIVYVPKLYLRDKADDLMGMVRDYMGSTSDRQQFSAYTDELLPNILLAERTAASKVIWTVEPATTIAANADGTLKTDTMIFEGKGKYSTRTTSEKKENGVYTLRLPHRDMNTYYLSTELPNKHAPSQLTLSHCIDFKSISINGPLGRCTAQFTTNEMLITMHYETALAPQAGALRGKISDLLEDWKFEPNVE